jgi:hypothetical protein
MTPRWLSLAGAMALALCGCGRPPAADEAARTFFDLIREGKVDEAHRSAAFTFQVQLSPAMLEARMQEYGISDFVSATFSAPKRDADGQTAEVAVEFITREKGKIPLDVTLQRDSGGWKVFGLNRPGNGRHGTLSTEFSLVGRGPDFVEPINRRPVPDEATVLDLVEETVMNFDAAVRDQSFEAFFLECSLAWQDQLITSEVRPGIPRTALEEVTHSQIELGASRLERAFRAFIENDVRLDGIERMKPTFSTPPRVTSDGLLEVSGEYATAPYHAVFTLKFTYEVPRWRLFGLDISLRKGPPPSASLAQPGG